MHVMLPGPTIDKNRHCFRTDGRVVRASPEINVSCGCTHVPRNGVQPTVSGRVTCGGASGRGTADRGVSGHWQHGHGLVRTRGVRFCHVMDAEETGLGARFFPRLGTQRTNKILFTLGVSGGGHVAGGGTSMLPILAIQYKKS